MQLLNQPVRQCLGTAVLFCMATIAHAQSGFYVGGTVGQSQTDVDRAAGDDIVLAEFDGPIARSSVDETDTGFGVLVGFQLVPWFALEAAYHDLGRASYEARTSLLVSPPSRAVPIDVEIATEARAVSLSGAFSLPVTEHFALGVRGGLAASEADLIVAAAAPTLDIIDSDTETFDNVAPVYGAFIEWSPLDNLGLRVEFQRFQDVSEDDDEDLEGFDVDLVSASVLWRF